MDPIDLYARYVELQSYLDWTEADRMHAMSVRDVVTPQLEAIVDDFYQEVLRHPATKRVLTDGSAQIERLRDSLRRWLDQLFSGTYDVAYVAARWQVGLRHAEIGLEMVYTHAALARLRLQIQRAIRHALPRSEAVAPVSEAVNKLLDLDLAIIGDSYEFHQLQCEKLVERERGERKFRNLVEAAACMIVIMREDTRVVYFSPYAERITGYAAEAIVAQSFLDRFVDRLGDHAGSADWRAILASLPVNDCELPILVRDGVTRWFAWNAIRLDDFDGHSAVLVVGHDVTEKRRSAERLLQAERLAAIGQTITGLAHESRNALQRINSCTEMLEFEVEDHPEALQLIRRSQQAQDDLTRLFDEVRSFAAPICLECSPSALSSIWHEAWQLVLPECRGRNVTLTEQSDDDQITLNVDRFRLVQVFRNLFENSLSACADPVQIAITCRSLPRGPNNAVASRAVEIRVRDNGPGLDPRARREVFEPFFTTKTKGTGLGMAIAHRIVTAHGGSITVGDSVRAGAEFVVVLPAEPQ